MDVHCMYSLIDAEACSDWLLLCISSASKNNCKTDFSFRHKTPTNTYHGVRLSSYYYPTNHFQTRCFGLHAMLKTLPPRPILSTNLFSSSQNILFPTSPNTTDVEVLFVTKTMMGKQIAVNACVQRRKLSCWSSIPYGSWSDLACALGGVLHILGLQGLKV